MYGSLHLLIRSVIHNYFKESSNDTNDLRYDVCSMVNLANVVDCHAEIEAIVKTIEHFLNKGEKQITQVLRGYSYETEGTDKQHIWLGATLHLSENY
uniref:Uncharacterized protein n=1 Tax=Amphimedon queenslandica TaxID=400682 RepID=A0A1X7SSK0_AMPQE